MIRHILVPLDGSKLAESVLPTAAAMADGFGAQVTLLHIIEERAPETVHGQPHLTDADEAQAYLEEVAGRPVFRDRTVELHVHRSKEGDVADSLMAHARELGADLVVLSTHGQGGLRRSLFGSIALRGLQRGTTPILLVNPTAEGGAPAFVPRKILVPLDGTAAHEPALPIASRLAQAWHAALHLILVVPTAQTLTGPEAATRVFMPMAKRALLDLAESGGDEYLRQLAGRLIQEGVPTTSQVSRGEPAASVIEATDKVGADLVVMATHAKGAMDGFWSGSLTPKLMQRLGRPLLLVRAEGEEANR
ncbi:MAG TPA: universal stress protein [Candidatus Methylomirabilis sp.]|nr:universal stress protein [Candidatus Methylomirabilis sp.]